MQLLRTVLRKTGINHLIPGSLRSHISVEEKKRARTKIIERYLQSQTVRKLQIGAGLNPLPDWLNGDFDTASPDIFYLNAIEPFPLDSNTFDYVFSEHMIEHISYYDGLKMLSESFRVLKPNGVIRIATPDLAFLVAMYAQQKSQLQLDYIKWTTETFLDNKVECEDTFVINNFVRGWGHQFIYDEKVLRRALEKTGFVNITKCILNQSSHGALINLENEKRSPPGFLELETIVLEGQKP